ncbi:MAG: 3-isopropylmalate dehydratase small subunit [Deltaproteobacteria bacterium]|nr:3-isopropylmalate dehydratase small subunit [Deltaproteobacteria bacterium]MCZ6907935.1 3-isopropylmalate dehydratase small subunit [Deltaproteobacteria bacterium]
MSTVTKIIQVTGTVIPVRGNDIDTDRILPARYLKEVTFSRMGEYPFYDERFDPEGKARHHPFNDARYKGASLLFVNKNFGCGSSREHAPQALFRYGIHALVGESFAAIFAGNCVMMGIPTVTVSFNKMEELMKLAESSPKTVYTVDLETSTLSYDGKQIRFDLPASSWNALVTGAWDSMSMLRANLGKVKETSSRLPYMTGFRD